MTTTPPKAISYNALLAKVQSETENTSAELQSQFPQMVRDAELMILRALDIQNLHVYADSNFLAIGTNGAVAGQCAYVSLPADCEIIRYIEYFLPVTPNDPSNDNITDQYSGTAVQLWQVDEAFIQIYWPNKSVTAPPQKYAVLGSTRDQSSPSGQILVAPTPDLPYAIRIAYITRPDSLDDVDPVTGSTYISTWYPDLLFYACMLRANEFMKNQAMATIWNGHYQAAVGNSQKVEARKKSQVYADNSQTTVPQVNRTQ